MHTIEGLLLQTKEEHRPSVLHIFKPVYTSRGGGKEEGNACMVLKCDRHF